ncbi:hypothetical protein KY308_00195 [Candidatus Woesearchaeota archaeon]|nr:hypothetical protein [Candidatus Woesearchaeota archaeon]
MDKGVIKQYYLREDIKRAIFECAKDREIAVKFDFGFGKRPETLQYATDVAEFAKQGALSFHCSEELWQNPLHLSTGLKKNELDDLRKGWDLVLDIDCPFLEYSQLAADLLVKALRSKGVKSVSVKFSGNHGFHIGVPFEAFPQNSKNFFPDGVKIIALYLQEMIRPLLAEEILKRENMEDIVKKTGKKFEEITKKQKSSAVFDPFKILAIDSILISSRHMFRMPYSINEKSGLASVPINPDRILDFKKNEAELWRVKADMKFLDRENVVPNEAKELFDSASEMFSQIREKEEIKERLDGEKTKNIVELTEAVPEELFPPCIKKALLGLEDGRKRFVFALINFLTMSGWDHDKVEEKIKEWNKNNHEPMRDNYWMGQLRYHKAQKKKILPPNCREFYKELGVCNPDNVCDKIKNPVSYGVWKMKGVKKKKAK